MVAQPMPAQLPVRLVDAAVAGDKHGHHHQHERPERASNNVQVVPVGGVRELGGLDGRREYVHWKRKQRNILVQGKRVVPGKLGLMD